VPVMLGYLEGEITHTNHFDLVLQISFQNMQVKMNGKVDNLLIRMRSNFIYLSINERCRHAIQYA